MFVSRGGSRWCPPSADAGATIQNFPVKTQLSRTGFELRQSACNLRLVCSTGPLHFWEDHASCSSMQWNVTCSGCNVDCRRSEVVCGRWLHSALNRARTVPTHQSKAAPPRACACTVKQERVHAVVHCRRHVCSAYAPTPTHNALHAQDSETPWGRMAQYCLRAAVVVWLWWLAVITRWVSDVVA